MNAPLPKAVLPSPPEGSRGKMVVLLSGGLDSATVAAWARARGYEVIGLSIDYGQRHRCELDAAKALASHLGLADHIVLRVDLSAFGGSALTDAAIPVPRDRPDAALAAEIPSTYVPARNTVFLSLALALAEARGATAIGLGVNAIDYSGLEAFRSYNWQRQLHLFEVPFYYIEYGIAQLGAIGMWKQYRDNPEKGLENYMKGLSLGGTKTLPELYAAAGIDFDFSPEKISELMIFVKNELEKL